MGISPEAGYQIALGSCWTSSYFTRIFTGAYLHVWNSCSEVIFLSWLVESDYKLTLFAVNRNLFTMQIFQATFLVKLNYPIILFSILILKKGHVYKVFSFLDFKLWSNNADCLKIFGSLNLSLEIKYRNKYYQN